MIWVERVRYSSTMSMTAFKRAHAYVSFVHHVSMALNPSDDQTVLTSNRDVRTEENLRGPVSELLE